MTRVTIVYPNPRAALIAEARAGIAPDTTLLGLNQLPRHGVDVRVRDSFFDTRAEFVPKRLRWHLRELTLPWEAGNAEVVFTPLANVIPFTARARRLPVVVYNFGLNTILRRANAARRADRARRGRSLAGARRTARRRPPVLRAGRGGAARTPRARRRPRPRTRLPNLPRRRRRHRRPRRRARRPFPQ